MTVLTGDPAERAAASAEDADGMGVDAVGTVGADAGAGGASAVAGGGRSSAACCFAVGGCGASTALDSNAAGQTI